MLLMARETSPSFLSMESENNSLAFPRGVFFSQSSSSLSASHGKPSKKGDALYRKGEGFLKKAALSLAQKNFESALNVCRIEKDSVGAARSLLKLGRALELKGLYAKALETYGEGAAQFKALEDQNGFARCRAFLGDIAWAQGDYPEALKILKEAHAIFLSTRNQAGEAWVRDLLGNLHLAMGQDQEAEKFHREAFALAGEGNADPEGKAWNHYHFGNIALSRGQVEPAEDLFSKALDIFVKLKDPLGQVAAHIHLGEIACGQNELMKAQKHFQSAIQLALPTECRPLLADAVTGVARLMIAQGEGRKAIGLLMVALSHPTCRRQTKDRMVSLSRSLEANFSKQEMESGFLWAKEFTLEEMAKSWISSLTAKGKK